MRTTIEHEKIAPEKLNRTQRSATADGINHRLVFDYEQYLRQPLSL